MRKRENQKVSKKRVKNILSGVTVLLVAGQVFFGDQPNEKSKKVEAASFDRPSGSMMSSCMNNILLNRIQGSTHSKIKIGDCGLSTQKLPAHKFMDAQAAKSYEFSREYIQPTPVKAEPVPKNVWYSDMESKANKLDREVKVKDSGVLFKGW